MKSRTLFAAFAGTLLAIAAALAVLAVASNGTAASNEPPETFGFVQVSVDGQTLALFPELQITSGLAPSQLELTTRGSELSKLLSTRTPPSVTLRHGLTSNPDISAWHEQAMLDNAAARKSVTLTVATHTGFPIARYELTNAWPSKLEISAESSSAGLGVEAVTIVAESIHRSQ